MCYYVEGTLRLSIAVEIVAFSTKSVGGGLMTGCGDATLSLEFVTELSGMLPE